MAATYIKVKEGQQEKNRQTDNDIDGQTHKETRMVQLLATAAIEYVAACCRTRTRTRTRTKIGTRTKTGTKTKIGTITKIVRGAYARFPQVQFLNAPSRLSVPIIVA